MRRRVTYHHQKHMDHLQFVLIWFHDRPFDHFDPFELDPYCLDDLELAHGFHIDLHSRHEPDE